MCVVCVGVVRSESPHSTQDTQHTLTTLNTTHTAHSTPTVEVDEHLHDALEHVRERQERDQAVAVVDVG